MIENVLVTCVIKKKTLVSLHEFFKKKTAQDFLDWNIELIEKQTNV